MKSGIGTEWLSWNTGAGLKQVGDHKKKKAQVHLLVLQNRKSSDTHTDMLSFKKENA